jgi:deoxycytidylate deaminase
MADSAEDLTSLISQAAGASTCQKRVVVCALYGASRQLLAIESNRCSPPNGVCCRLATANKEGDYPSNSECNWEHAEKRAIDSLLEDVRPTMAVIYGHDFACPDCQELLRSRGVRTTEIGALVSGTGLR